MPFLKLIDGYKTYAAAIGLLALSVYQFTQNDIQTAAQTFLAALAAFGLRDAIKKAN